MSDQYEIYAFGLAARQGHWTKIESDTTREWGVKFVPAAQLAEANADNVKLREAIKTTLWDLNYAAKSGDVSGLHNSGALLDAALAAGED